jgi:hypothetical protein
MSESTFTRLKAFLAEPEEAVSWVVADLLPTGGLSLLGAKPKVGKSTLARAIAHAVSTGLPCLGRQTSRGLVLYVSIEERRSDVRRHFALLGDEDDPDLVVHVGPVPGTPKGANREGIRRHRLAWLTAQLERYRPVLVVIDTFALFIALKDANDYSEVNEVAAPLIALARSSGTHFLFTHHARKQEAELIDALVGSTGIVGAVDTVMLLRRHPDGSRTIQSNQRVGLEFDETLLQLDKTTGTLSTAGTVEDARLDAAIQRLVSFLSFPSRSGTPATESELLKAVEGRADLLVRAIREAVSRGTLRRTGDGKPRKPYYYSLPGNEIRTRYERDERNEGNERNERDETDDESLVLSFPSFPGSTDPAADLAELRRQIQTPSRGRDSLGRRLPGKSLDGCVERGLDQLENATECLGTWLEDKRLKKFPDFDDWLEKLAEHREVIDGILRRAESAESTDQIRPQTAAELCACSEPAVAWSADEGFCSACWERRCRP